MMEVQRDLYHFRSVVQVSWVESLKRLHVVLVLWVLRTIE